MSDDRQRWEARYTHRDPAVKEAPSEFLVAHAESIHGRVLDIAAGPGRNALFLARRGNVIEAIDISFTGLQIARAAAVAEGLRLFALQTDLESFPLPTDRYDAIINIRYLQRSLLAPMQRAVKPGGVILFDTFLIDQQTVGHPRNPEFLLRHGELRAAFSRCDILVYEEGLFPTAPRPAYLARMLARRPMRRVD